MVNPAGLVDIAKRAVTLVSALPQSKTNGNSTWGTLDAPLIEDFLTNNPLPNGYPWSLDTAKNTNPYTSPPRTGITRYYDFTIERGMIAPDGYLKESILINGQFPGPKIEANWGDTIQVKVNNQITGPEEEGTALHWHGILQKETPWYDGTPSVQQCPIAPGASFTYRFKADLYGSSWYHSHYSSQYAGGLFGPMIIHGPKNVPYDIDLGPVMLSDHYHSEYFDLVKLAVGTDITKAVFNSDNNLINGKGEFDCSTVTDGTPCTNNAGLAKFKFRSGKSHRLRLINTSAEATQRFTIDNHTMTVMANDFVPVQPYDTTVVTLGVGQRTDVIVKAKGKPRDAYWMRSDISAACSLANKPNALAAIYYEKADTKLKPTTKAQPYTEENCNGDDLSKTVPVYQITPDPIPAARQDVDITFGRNASGNWLWSMNNSTFRANYNNPLLLLAKLGNTSYPDDPEWNVYNFGSNKTILINVYNDSPAPHPMHIHGHNMFILSVGPGRWDGKTVVNPKNPQRRDVQMLDARNHLVLQIDADNPGVWPFHCHIAWHVSGGLYINIMERPGDIKQMQIPSIMAQTCRDWTKYTDSNMPEQIDSGL
ncbi:MAG: hypothetical protein M1837_002913 [Sclerophora amabilis]|nr:MAG: hypothetical protein M1837_002913 [Sclerophora amabilis]